MSDEKSNMQTPELEMSDSDAHDENHDITKPGPNPMSPDEAVAWIKENYGDALDRLGKS